MEADMRPDQSGMIDLDALSIEELERLQAIRIAMDAGIALLDLPDDDLRFIASLRVKPED
jgi:hypothetical protein